MNTPHEVKLWVEKGFSRREIVPRMTNAAPNLRIYSTRRQPIPNTEIIEYPSYIGRNSTDKFNELIAEHGIDAIWPQNSARHDLSGITAEVHAAATPEVIALVDDKARFTEWLGSDDPMQANSTEVLGAEGVAEEYEKRRQEGRDVCVKPIIGVFGQGYWHLTDKAEASLLNTPEEREIHPEVYLAALAIEEAHTKPQRLLVMDYLPGPEVSLDMLYWRGEPVVHAARTKFSDGHQRIQSEHVVLDHAHAVATRLGMHGIISMQYRLDNDQNWKILEMNPRPAGGSINSEDAGFDIISNWARLVAHTAEPDEIRQHHDDVMLEVSRTLTIKKHPI